MLKHMNLTNFAAFRRAELDFCSGLNVIVGENASGKTHLLKLGYLVSTIWEHEVKKQNLVSKESVERHIAERVKTIFQPEKIGNLSTNGANGKSVVSGSVAGSIPTVTIRLPHEQELPSIGDEIEWAFRFSGRAETKVNIDELPKRLTANAVYGNAVYLPAKEMLSFIDGFIALYERHELPFDATYRDLAVNLVSPKLKEKPQLLEKFLGDLSQAIGGEVVLEGGRFYIREKTKKQKTEVTLLAEGLRKLATIAQLIENGSLEAGDTLFWDEPETNLNPRLIKLVAEGILHLCRNGIQVVLATHSLFLLRELEILSNRAEFTQVCRHYFALKAMAGGVNISQGDSVESIDPLVLLDESLEQSDRYLATC